MTRRDPAKLQPLAKSPVLLRLADFDRLEGAACADAEDPDLFFVRGRAREAAKRFCDRCPVQAQCYEAGVQGDEWGLWGGEFLLTRVRQTRKAG